MAKKSDGRVRRTLRALREIEWVASLMEMVGTSGLVSGVLGGAGLGGWAIQSGIAGPAGVFMGLGAASFIAFLVGAVRMNRSQGSLGTLEIHERKMFADETIRLDGYSYVKCLFKDCTFVYNGGHFNVSECKIEGSRKLLMLNQPAVRTLQLASVLGFVQPTESSEQGVFEIPKSELRDVLSLDE